MNRIICGDCFIELKKIPDKSVDLIVTDPPYEISQINGGGSVNTVKKLNKSLEDLETANIRKGYDIISFCEECMRVMKEPNIYIWCNKKQIPTYFDFFVEKYNCKFDILVWNKPNALPTYSNKYLTDCEYCLYFRSGKGKCFPKSYEDAKTVFTAPINISDKKKYNHPTIKPLEFIRAMIRNSSQQGDMVLDPFAGSGTTAVACELEHRDCICIEINPEYANIISNRLKEISFQASAIEYMNREVKSAKENKSSSRRLF